jgi:hypothetical protein
MIVDLDEKTESGSFELKGGGKVHLRLLSATDLKEMAKACIKVNAEYPLLKDPIDGKEKYQRFEGRTFNDELWEEMKCDRAITGWDDLFDKNGNPIPCTKENKVLLMTPGKAPEFLKAVEEGLKALKEADTARAEGAEKNSQTGSDGAMSIPSPAQDA